MHKVIKIIEKDLDGKHSCISVFPISDKVLQDSLLRRSTKHLFKTIRLHLTTYHTAAVSKL